ncbi:MAG: hypothetical protein QM779_05135 [Propionicimonas sp.]|uniref:hypothetical protein n=1 Tax=Propionicimonas sp. TaxID=1955623 RepID=UPI003D0C1269
MTTPQPPFPGQPGSVPPAGYQPAAPDPTPYASGSPYASDPQFAGQPNGQPNPGAPVPPAPKRSHALTSKAVIGVAALVIGLVLGSAAGGSGKTATTTAEAVPTVTVTATETATYEATAEAEETEEPSDDPTEEPEPAKTSYKILSSRGFKLLAKDPDSYIGKTYIIHGEVTQFDSATGTDTFRADTGPKKLRISYGFVDYEQNSILTGDKSKLKKLVEGDCFNAKVTVLGSYSYDTQIGGNTTVPLFEVDSISVYGSTD